MHVLIRVEDYQSNSRLDTDINPWLHAPCTGTVVSSIDELLYHGREINELKTRYPYLMPDHIQRQIQKLTRATMEWETTIEITEGDFVWFDYGAQEYCQKKGLIHEDVMAIPYYMLYCVKRAEEIIMLNGNVMIQKAEETTENMGVSFTQTVDKGIVLNTGSLITHYLNYGFVDTDEVQVGDTILYNKKAAFKIEYSLHQRMEGENRILKRKDILAK